MRVKVTTIIAVEGGATTEPSVMEYDHFQNFGDNPRYWADSILRAVGASAGSIAESLAPKVDLKSQD